MFEILLTNICSWCNIISEQKFDYICADIEREQAMSMRERTLCHENRRAARRTYFVIASTIALMLCIVTCIFVMNSNAKEEHETYKYYTSIQIQEGDSLWEIAQEYGALAHIDSRDYIAEVKEINHLQGDEIHSGQYLTIPYYSAQIK